MVHNELGLIDLDGEIWMPTKVGNRDYLVSNKGRIKSPNYKRLGFQKVLKQRINEYGYLTVELGGKYSMAHRVILSAFVLNHENKRTVNHINGVKTDNRVENLEWATYSENVIHRFKVLKHKGNCSMAGRFGINNPKSKPVTQKTKEGEFVANWNGMGDAARALNISHAGISMVAKGAKKSYKGFVWEYANLP
jgi:hypothetical protein